MSARRDSRRKLIAMRRVILLASLCLVTAQLRAQTPAPARDPSTAATSALEGFDEFVRSAMKSWNVPGLAVAIVKDGEVVLAKGLSGFSARFLLESGKPTQLKLIQPNGVYTLAKVSS